MTAHLCGLDMPSDRVPLLGAMWPGAMVRCHCWGAVRAHVGGLDVPSDRVPLLRGGDCTRSRIAGCHVVKVPLLGAIAGCNRRGVVITHFDRLDVVPLLGVMVRCHSGRHCWGGG